MSEGEEVKVEFVRTLDRAVAYPASATLVKRNDMYPCDAHAVLLSSGTTKPPVAAAPVASAPDEKDESKNAAITKRLIDLKARAKELKIKNAHNMKEETLMDKIAIAEAALVDAK